MTQLYAQPYDLSACGFYFESADEFNAESRRLRNDHGEPVEEFEIQFIDGEDIDAALAKAWYLSQASFAAFLDAAESWSDDDKIRYIVAVDECGYSHEQAADDPDIDLYELNSLRELSVHFVEEGLFGEIPESLQFYLDYDAIARDLSADYSETNIAGINLIYRCV